MVYGGLVLISQRESPGGKDDSTARRCVKQLFFFGFSGKSNQFTDKKSRIITIITASDTIRILISTDNHVGYNERDPVRGDDSWKSFDEVMCLAKDQDVDMVLLAGDLFHENKPSRKSMYQVMRSLRANCYSEKPCELEVLSDASDNNFSGSFNHVNYEDPDINVGIPVFSIHGNHDDPAGEGHLAALDILQVSGLLNYYGRTPESDNIQIKPVLLQKGRTKLALYGMSNVRDERLFRTFRDGKVKFFRPGVQQRDWFNLMAVHQNHSAHTETGYLPENFLPDFLDLVIWGHEHECLINPRLNPEMDFHVMQPGSSVATSLVPGEAVSKQVAILNVTGRQFKVNPIRLQTVRPFVMREIILRDQPAIKRSTRRNIDRTEITRILMGVVEEMITEAKNDWLESHQGEDDHSDEDEDNRANEAAHHHHVPLPLVRLRVEISRSDGSHYDCENPQRFSNRFVDRVANANDVVQFHRKKAKGGAGAGGAASAALKGGVNVEGLDQDAATRLAALDAVKLDKVVQEVLEQQSLTILPQNPLNDAFAQFIDKDDKHAVEIFLNDLMKSQVKHLLSLDQDADGGAGDEDGAMEDEDDARVQSRMDELRARMEQRFAGGGGNQESEPRRRGGTTTTTATTTTATTARARGNTASTRDQQQQHQQQQQQQRPSTMVISDDDDDFDMDDDEFEASARPPPPAPRPQRSTPSTSRGGRGSRAGGSSSSSVRGAGTTRARGNNSSSSSGGRAGGRAGGNARTEKSSMLDDIIDDDDDDDDDDAFETASSSARPSRRGRR